MLKILKKKKKIYFIDAFLSDLKNEYNVIKEFNKNLNATQVFRSYEQ